MIQCILEKKKSIKKDVECGKNVVTSEIKNVSTAVLYYINRVILPQKSKS